MSKKKVHRYTEEFRRQAVSLADQPGKQLAKSPNPSASMLTRYITGVHSSANYPKSSFRSMRALIMSKMNLMRINVSNMRMRP